RGSPEIDHVLILYYADSRPAPGTSDHIQAVHRKIDGGFIRAFVMPIADQHIFWNHAHRACSVVHACLPHSHSGRLSVDEAIAPDPQPPVLPRKMVPDLAHFVCKQFSLVMAGTAGAF